VPVFNANMFFHSCDEIWSGRKGIPWSWENLRRQYTRRFRVIAKIKEMEAVAVVRCPGLPLPLSFYITAGIASYNTAPQYPIGFDLLALLKSYSVEQEHEDDWQCHIVTCEYDTDVGRPFDINGNFVSPNQTQQDPTLEPPEVEWDHETIQVTKHQWIKISGSGETETKLALTNSAGQPFTPAPTFPLACPVLSMTRNEADYNEAKAIQFSYALNDATFLGAEVGMAQALPVKAKQKFKGTFPYWTVSYKIRFAPKNYDGHYQPWQPLLLDQGTVEYIPGPPGEPLKGRQREIWDRGHPVSTPRLLDGNGLVKKPNTTGPLVGIIEPVYITREVYRYEDLSTLLVYGMS